MVTNKVAKRYIKAVNSGTRSMIVKTSSSPLSSFGRRSLFEITQSQTFKTYKKNLPSADCEAAVDSSVNFTCLRQAETLSAYYSRTQIIFHPIVASVSSEH